MMLKFIAQIDADMPQSGYGSASEEHHHHTSETGKMYKLMYTNSLHKLMQICHNQVMVQHQRSTIIIPQKLERCTN
jgi:hypothetical protein